ncbi:MAG: hypothetical protein H0V61_06835 [Chitinophagales bacterium]|nr:hypothetical protein [Chitinophagales bacterium]
MIHYLNYLNKLFYPALPVSLLTFSNIYEVAGYSFSYAATEVKSTQIKVVSKDMSKVVASVPLALPMKIILTTLPFSSSNLHFANCALEQRNADKVNLKSHNSSLTKRTNSLASDKLNGSPPL